MAEVNMPQNTKVMPDYPSNSYKSRRNKEQEEVERAPVKRVVNEPVTKRKKTLGKRLSEAFFGEETKGIADYIIYDVLIPAAKDTLHDAVTGGIDRILYGETSRKPSHVDRNRGRSYAYSSHDYRQYSSKPTNRTTMVSSGGYRSERARLYNDSVIVLQSRNEAESVIDQLIERIYAYGMATVADLYEMVGQPTEFTDNNYGWDNLDEFERVVNTKRARDGWVLILPPVIVLD